MKPIRKAIFPVAGLGTRFLPATKAMPKEMLPVVDRPLIQHVVDEAREAGIEHFIFVTGRNKAVIEDHFDRQFELELTLQERNKKSEIAMLESDLPGAGTTSCTVRAATTASKAATDATPSTVTTATTSWKASCACWRASMAC